MISCWIIHLRAKRLAGYIVHCDNQVRSSKFRPINAPLTRATKAKTAAKTKLRQVCAHHIAKVSCHLPVCRLSISWIVIRGSFYCCWLSSLDWAAVLGFLGQHELQTDALSAIGDCGFTVLNSSPGPVSMIAYVLSAKIRLSR